MRKLILLLCLVVAASLVLLAGPCRPAPVYQLPQLPAAYDIDVSATNIAPSSQLVEFTFAVTDLRSNEVVATARAAATAGHWVQAMAQFAGAEVLRDQAIVDATGTVEYTVTFEKGANIIARREGTTAVTLKQGT